MVLRDCWVLRADPEEVLVRRSEWLVAHVFSAGLMDIGILPQLGRWTEAARPCEFMHRSILEGLTSVYRPTLGLLGLLRTLRTYTHVDSSCWVIVSLWQVFLSLLRTGAEGAGPRLPECATGVTFTRFALLLYRFVF